MMMTMKAKNLLENGKTISRMSFKALISFHKIRENNRKYAQKSRLRKKNCIESLRKAVKSLESENDQLKALLNFYGIYYQGIPPLQL